MKDIIVVTGASSGLGKEFVKQIETIENVDEILMYRYNEDAAKKWKI